MLVPDVPASIENGGCMSRSHLSKALAGSLLCAGSLFADPMLVADWCLTDQRDIVHEYNAFALSGVSWEGASLLVDDSWYLATVTSREEQEVLIAGLAGLTGEYWIGGFQMNVAGAADEGWNWSTGESWNYCNWATGEPNDYFGQGSEQHLAVWSQFGKDQWLWNDEGSTGNISGFIAERTQSVPEPGKLPLFAICWLVLLGFVRRRKADTHAGKNSES